MGKAIKYTAKLWDEGDRTPASGFSHVVVWEIDGDTGKAIVSDTRSSEKYEVDSSRLSSFQPPR